MVRVVETLFQIYVVSLLCSPGPYCCTQPRILKGVRPSEVILCPCRLRYLPGSAVEMAIPNLTRKCPHHPRKFAWEDNSGTFRWFSGRNNAHFTSNLQTKREVGCTEHLWWFLLQLHPNSKKKNAEPPCGCLSVLGFQLALFTFKYAGRQLFVPPAMWPHQSEACTVSKWSEGSNISITVRIRFKLHGHSSRELEQSTELSPAPSKWRPLLGDPFLGRPHIGKTITMLNACR